MRQGYDTTEKIRYWLFADRIPLTKSLIVITIFTYVLVMVFRLEILSNLLGFSTSRVLMMPWTLVTYPLVAAREHPISLFFMCYWLWVTGGSLERSWSTRGFAFFFFSMSAISALGLVLGSIVIGTGTYLLGLWLPLSGLTIAFAMRNPEQQILFFFIIPLKLKYLALLDVILVLVSFGMQHPLLGVFALTGCAYSYWYIQPNRFEFSLPQRQPRQDNRVVHVYPKESVFSKLNVFRKWKEHRDKQRLKKLFERSFGDEDGN